MGLLGKAVDWNQYHKTWNLKRPFLRPERVTAHKCQLIVLRLQLPSPRSFGVCFRDLLEMAAEHTFNTPAWPHPSGKGRFVETSVAWTTASTPMLVHHRSCILINNVWLTYCINFFFWSEFKKVWGSLFFFCSLNRHFFTWLFDKL